MCMNAMESKASGWKRLAKVAAAILVLAANAASIPSVEAAGGPSQTSVFSYRRRVALCVGINEYSDHARLGYAVNDAVAMAGMLQSYGFDEVVLLKNREATREAILSELKRIRDDLREDDFIVVFFAGHGVTVRKPEGESQGVLLPYGCRRGHEISDGLPMSDLTALAQDLPARHTLFLIDACYSGLGLGGGVPASAVATKKSRGSKKTPAPAVAAGRRSLQILTAGGERDRAFEFGGHGLFTQSILDCLSERSSENADGVVSGFELAAAVRDRVARETGGWQTPQFGFVGDGDLVLRREAPTFAAATSLSAVR
jgi:uncharacterized caspase-like protein